MAYGLQVAYTVSRISLANASTQGVPIIETQGASVASIAILSLPPGASFSLKLGSGDEIPVTDRLGPLSMDPPHNAGVSYIVPTAQAGEAVVLFGYWQPCPPMTP